MNTSSQSPQRALRVAVVTETYPPDVNGVAGTLATVVEHLRARERSVQLVRLRQPGEAGGVTTEEVRLRGMPIPFYPHLQMGLPCSRTLARLWHAQRPDIVYLATEGPLGLSALRAAERLGLPTVSEFRTNFHSYAGHYRIGWLRHPVQRYLRNFHNRSGCTMVPSAGQHAELAALGFDRLVVVGRGVDTVRFSPAWRSRALRVHWGADDATVVVLHVGRLAPEKNLQLWWRSVQAMRAAGLKVLPLLVGDGPARADCERQYDGAVFAGMRRGDELSAHYASADLFVFPSLSETFGNVTLEAMASGLPVVAFDHAAAARLVQPGYNGLKAAPDRPDQFVALAVDAARQRQRLVQWSLQARHTAHSQGWQEVVDEIEAVMRSQFQPRAAAATTPVKPVVSAAPQKNLLRPVA